MLNGEDPRRERKAQTWKKQKSALLWHVMAARTAKRPSLKTLLRWIPMCLPLWTGLVNVH